MKAAGFQFDTARREFNQAGIPVHLVTIDQLGEAPTRFTEIDGTTTLALEELIEMKLRSGTSDPLRAQDLADVIGLIRAHDLSSGFATKIAPSLRPDFRRLVQAIRKSR